MSNGPTFEDVIYHLRNNPDGNVRVQAAQMLGDYVADLNDEQYEIAHKTLNEALIDKDPMVIMSVMQSMSRFNRKARQQAREAKQSGDVRSAVAIKLCTVCNKPEALADGSICPHDNCPYK
jgi:hypothetical protein